MNKYRIHLCFEKRKPEIPFKPIVFLLPPDAVLKEVYNSKEPYSGILIKNFGESKKGVFRLLTINLYPYQYLPLLNRLILYDIKVKIEYENSNKFVKINRNQFEFHKKGVEKIVINPEVIDF